MNGFDFRFDQNAMIINYIGEVILKGGAPSNMVHFVRDIDCGKVRGSNARRHNPHRLIFAVLPLGMVVLRNVGIIR